MDIVHKENYFFNFLSMEHKFHYLLTNFCHEAAGFIYKIFDLRDFLLQHPKRRE